MLQRMDLGNERKSYLNVTNLQPGMPVQGLALLKDIKAKIDSNGKPFIVYHLVEVNKITLIGREFSVTNINDRMLSLASLKGTVISVTGVPALWNKNVSLVVDALSPTSEDPAFFYHGYTNIDSVITALEKALEKETGKECNLPAWWRTLVVSSIGNNLRGGIVNVCKGAFNRLVSIKDVEYIETKVLFEAFYRTMLYYGEYLVLQSRMDVIPRINVVDICNSNQPIRDMDSEEFKISSIATDAYLSLVNVGEASHFYSAFISNAIKETIRDLNIAYNIPMMLATGSFEGSGLSLVNY